MGKKKKNQSSSSSSATDLLQTLGDFTSKENWDKFFTIRGTGDSFEWYAEWPQLRDPLISLIGAPTSSPPPQILVPGCGNSRLSEHLYDAGFHGITNVDFSKVVISDMLRRNVRDRSDMRWRVMDMTSMQFMDETFDVVLDKGGLDALMEPELGHKLGNQYLSEVKRLLKSGGKFVCLTLAESHVLGLLFPKFRFGWKMSVHAIPQKSSSEPSLQTFMVVADKENSSVVLQVTSSFDHSSLDCNKNQAFGIHEALESENQTRREYSHGSDILYSLEDLQLGAKGDMKNLSPGCRFKLILGGEGDFCFSYRAVLLDARENSGPFMYNCGVFIVPKTRAHEWLFSSEEGQWLVVESSKAARLIMVLLDTSHASASMDEIQKDLSPLVKQLAPGKDDQGAQIPFMMAGDGIKHRNVVHQATSSLTGPIIVEDLVYENVDPEFSRIWPSEDLKFRRLVFQRTQGLVQSEALLMRDGSSHRTDVETERKKASSSSKSKRKGTQRRSDDSGNQLKVYHGYLASSYHMGIISGFTLISSYLESVASVGKSVKAVVIGLGAGLLPMFLHECMPFVGIEAVELDLTMLNLAEDYFGFTQDKSLKVHITDGIKFVREMKSSSATDEMSVVHGNEITSNNTRSCNGNCTASNARVDILIIDVDSPDSSSGMTCPAADFVEGSFLLTVKDALSEQGLFIVNLVSRSQATKDMVISRMKMVFNHLFCLQLEEDVNLVLFGLSSESCIKDNSFPEAAVQLGKLVKFQHLEISQSIMDAAKKIRCLK
ncbi:methyltransferase 11 domain-containing protein [Citrus sinensis]|uniref:Methyltransferase 11 domain-containing protein n=1 Tax=Citrus sinensis TaxID=2711 RepID=A0ACB8I0V9_CITSI|nr:methyltransferase 11 domain-containing protein [Citrus sinensis]